MKTQVLVGVIGTLGTLGYQILHEHLSWSLLRENFFGFIFPYVFIFCLWGIYHTLRTGYLLLKEIGKNVERPKFFKAKVIFLSFTFLCVFAAISILVGVFAYRRPITQTQENSHKEAANVSPTTTLVIKKQQKPPTAHKLNLTFTNSPVLTARRKERIAEQMGAFSSYLGTLGFEPLETLPPIGTRRGKVQLMTLSRPGSVYADAIFIAEKSIDDPNAARTAFASYYFDVTLGGFGDQNMTLYDAKTQLAGIYEVYFLESYTGKHQRDPHPSSISRWVDALWDIRVKFGKRFTDKGLFIGAARRDEIVKIGNPDSYAGTVILAGLTQLVNDKQKDTEAISKILSKHVVVQNSQ